MAGRDLVFENQTEMCEENSTEFCQIKNRFWKTIQLLLTKGGFPKTIIFGTNNHNNYWDQVDAIKASLVPHCIFNIIIVFVRCGGAYEGVGGMCGVGGRCGLRCTPSFLYLRKLKTLEVPLIHIPLHCFNKMPF